VCDIAERGTAGRECSVLVGLLGKELAKVELLLEDLNSEEEEAMGNSGSKNRESRKNGKFTGHVVEFSD
jgi:hypothetical protein